MSDDSDDLHFLDEKTAAWISGQLRGVTDVVLRIMEGNPYAGPEISAFLMTLGISVRSEPLGMISPPPRQRVSLRFSGATAIVTVAPQVPVAI